MNTAIAALMEFVNAAYKWDCIPRSVAEDFVLLLAPFAPHIAEDLWERLGHDGGLAHESWPVLDEVYLVEETVRIAVQVNGRVRATMCVSPDAEREKVLQAARSQENVARYLGDAPPRKEIYVPGRIVNFVAG